ncbi:hypothetical protein APR08_000394 [Nocardia amikacinitolerans]|nr:hypothetical protein [Nocardia amikacinitolerans]
MSSPSTYCALAFDLHPAPALYGGRVMWPGTATRAVFEAFTGLTERAPDELSLWFHRFQFPDAPPMVALDVAYLGDAEAAGELLAGVDAIGGAIADKRGELSVANPADSGDVSRSAFPVHTGGCGSKRRPAGLPRPRFSADPLGLAQCTGCPGCMSTPGASLNSEHEPVEHTLCRQGPLFARTPEGWK